MGFCFAKTQPLLSSPQFSRSDIKEDWIPFFKGMTPVKYKINLTGQAEETGFPSSRE